jgi:chaperonin GroES
LYDQCLIRQKAAADKYGSIIIPDSAKEKTVEGVVIATGRGISNHIHGGIHVLCVKIGDRVLFSPPSYAGTEVETPEGKNLLLREDEIMARIGPDGTLHPIHDRVFVSRKPEVGTIGLIIVPDSAREKTQEGTVVAVGSGKILENGMTTPLELRIGDQVLFGSKYAGTEIEFEGKKVLVLRQDDIAVVLEA